MELGPEILEKLSVQQRQKINKQQRQKQIQNYLQFIKTEAEAQEVLGKRNEKKKRKPNKKKTIVNFGTDVLLQDAVENFDDRRVSKLLKQGGNSNYTTGNNTTLLHKCAGEDNASTAEILIKCGADVNAQDDDWWTPLHVAASCDSTEIIRLLLNNKADCSLLDVDGFFPVDHAPDGSEAQQILTQHMESQGINEKKRKHIQFLLPRQMYNEIQDHLNKGGNPNRQTEDNVTSLHIACANGYKKVIKLLMKNGADLNSLDDHGWSPLHVAARFNQLTAVQLLLRQKADANLKDRQGCKPSAVTGSDEIRRLLTKAERNRQFTDSELTRSSEIEEDEEEEEEEDHIEEKDVVMEGVLLRINSRTVRPKRISLSKQDELSEAQTITEQQHSVYDEIGHVQPLRDVVDSKIDEEVTDDDKTDDEHEEKEEEIYVSKLWRADDEKAVLPTVDQSDNLKQSADISEETILNQLQQRFNSGQIYTFIGNILIAVNPFKDLPLYAKSISTKYHTENREELPPHVYAVAEEAYCKMLTNQTPQCCVISGESGAGKTETCKFLVQHLARVTASDENNLNSKINQVNPVLEAFGNAKTVINENSSRFAKFISICFNNTGKITGAFLTEYLLEKSRVVNQQNGELNFHIFYWMFSGLSPEERSLYKIKNLTSHRYLLQRDIEPSNLLTTENKEKFWELKDCLKFIGFTQDDIQGLLLTLSAVLHLGDITFRTDGSNDTAIIANMDKVNEASEMLNISLEELSSALTAEYTMARGEQIKKERTVHQANDCRDALAKAIYSRLFSWIVNGINQMIQPVEEESTENLQIGILDIFGFENFARNSFEQICINLANEQMQNYTNDHIFYMEQQDCLLEGIQLVELDYKNNQPIIDAFMEKHTGVLAILDEESRFPKATDQSLTTKLHQGPGKKYPDVYKTPKGGNSVFTILHYAGSVTYDLQGVLEKNRDTLPNSILYTVKTSNSLLIKELFQSKITRTGSLAPSARQQRSRRRTTTKSPFEFFKRLRGGKGDDKNKTKKKTTVSVERKGPATMAYHFKNSLGELMSKVQSATPHIIRCIRPNTKRSAMLFDSDYVLAQLRYTGIAETIKIKKFGYPLRIKFHEFLTRYNVIVVCYIPSHYMLSVEEKCQIIIDACKLGTVSEDYKIGKTKLFLRDSHAELLDKKNNEFKQKIVTAQSVVRRFLAQKAFNKMAVQQQYQREMDIATFCHQVSLQQGQVLSWLTNQKASDNERYLNQRKVEEVGEICKSLDELDTLLDEYVYEDAYSKKTVPVALEGQPDHGQYVNSPDSKETDMNGRVYRSLPAPPIEDITFSNDVPPPCPRQMYSQPGIYDVIQDPQDHYIDRSSKAPPPPRRNPETRLSRSSSAASDYDDTVVHQRSRSPVQSPRQRPMSPQMQVKHGGQPPPNPSSNTSKPFSYLPSMPGSPKQQRRSESCQYDVPDLSPKYEHIIVNGQSKNNHVIQGQGHLQGQPMSPGHVQGHMQMSPKSHRKSSGSKAMSPVLNRKLSDKRIHHGDPPPVFPAPPPPMPVAARFVAAIVEPNRSPSPPLPPPPPELQGQQGHLPPPSHVGHLPPPSHLGHQSHDQPPIPPPISKIPGRSAVSSFEIGKKSRPESTPVKTGYDEQETVNVPNRQSYQPQQMSSLANDLNKVKLKPGINNRDVNINCDIQNSKNGQQNQSLAAEIGKIRLTPVSNKETSSTDRQESDIDQIIKPRLRPTGPKPWELDRQQPEHSTIIPETEEDDLPPPPPPELPLPPLPDVVQSTAVEIIPQNNAVNKQRKEKSKSSNPSLSGMDINLDEIDLSQVPGYTVITSAVPNWKRDMVEKKNKEKLDEYIQGLKKKEKQLQRKKEEAEKWANVPEWKRKLMEEKEKLKEQQDQAKTEAIKQQAKAERDAEERKRRERKVQMEREEEMRKELADVPEWKREIMIKRGGEIKNWGDEREDVNKDEDGEEY